MQNPGEQMGLIPTFVGWHTSSYDYDSWIAIIERLFWIVRETLQNVLNHSGVNYILESTIEDIPKYWLIRVFINSDNICSCLRSAKHRINVCELAGRWAEEEKGFGFKELRPSQSWIEMGESKCRCKASVLSFYYFCNKWPQTWWL